jgi:hypothetical protein
VTGDAQAESCSDSILGIPIATDASLFTALELARKNAGAEGLVDVVVDQWSLVTFFYNKRCTVVHAKGIRFGAPPEPPRPAVAPAPTPPPAAPAALPLENPPAKPEAPAAAAKPAKPEKPLTAREQAALAKAKAVEEKKRAEEEKKRAAEEAKRVVEEKKRAEEEAKRKAEEDERRALAKKAEEEEKKPVPEEFWPYCKFKAGEAIRVETKAEVIEADFVECVHFGIRVRAKGQDPGVVPFEKIWSVTKVQAPPAPAPEPSPAPPPPAHPAPPAPPAPAAQYGPAKPHP